MEKPEKGLTEKDQKTQKRTSNLKESEERYHKMIEEVQDYAILLLDRNGFIQNWNKGAEKIKGYTEKEILGKNFRIFYLDRDREDKLPEKLIEQALNTGRAMHEGLRLRKDGTTFWGSIVITALHDKDNNIIGFSKVTRDLTEKKLADDQLKLYARDIEIRNKQLEEYAYIASHDLQEPLRKIQIFAELLENNLNNEAAARKNLEKINSAARRMSSLIKDVLKYSQLSHTDEHFTDIDLHKIINAIKEDYELVIDQKKAVIITKDLPIIKGLPVQMHQLFSNLISNALKFSSEKPVIEIKAEKLPQEEAKNLKDLNIYREYAKITFRDNGIGFEEQYRDQVFKMFKRLESDSTGTGIGLAL